MTVDHDQDRMLAVVKTGPGDVRLQRVPVPGVAAGQALVRVIATGICGTDVHVARDEYPSEPPVVMGHEILGEVAGVGSPEDDHWVGARVVCETYFSACEVCAWCRSGRRNLCPDRRSLGSYEDGGFAAFVRMPVLNLHRVPERITGIDAVLAEPLACVAQCLLDPPVISAADRVLVVGPGAMGQLAAQVAMASGGRVKLAGLEKDADRLAIAEAVGVDTTTSAPESEGYDVVIECSGSAAGAATALTAAARGARYVQVGIFGKDVVWPVDLVLYKELTVTSGFASTAASWKRAVSLMEDGIVQLGPLVTTRVPIEEWESAFEQAAAGNGIKTVIIPARTTAATDD